MRLVAPAPYLYRDDPIDKETAEFFQLCLGKAFRIEGFYQHGQLELGTTEKGSRRKASHGLNTHTIWIEPEFVEPFSKSAGAA